VTAVNRNLTECATDRFPVMKIYKTHVLETFHVSTRFSTIDLESIKVSICKSLNITVLLKYLKF